MIHRKPTAFNRFLARLFRRAALLTGLFLLVGAGLFLSVRLGRASRAVTIQSPAEEVQPPLRAPDSLRLLTYNMAQAGGPGRGTSLGGDTPSAPRRERLQRIADRISALNLDLVFLQEVDFHTSWEGGVDAAELIAAAAGLPHIVRLRAYDTRIPFHGRYESGSALLSRFPIAAAQWVRLPPFSHWEDLLAGNHDALAARVRIGTEQELLLLGAHLDSRDEEIRVRAAGRLIEIQRAHPALPTLLLGNLNSTPPGLPGSQTSSSGQNTLEILESFGGFQRRPPPGQTTPRDFTFPTLGPRRVIDWILADRNWAFTQYQVVHDLRESDHLAVLATLRRR